MLQDRCDTDKFINCMSELTVVMDLVLVQLEAILASANTSWKGFDSPALSEVEGLCSERSPQGEVEGNQDLQITSLTSYLCYFPHRLRPLPSSRHYCTPLPGF
jgi:hypothetical protein